MNKIIEKYNTPETVLVVTSFPGKGNFNAVAWHSQKTLSSLSKRRKVLVCAEKIAGSDTVTINDNFVVARVWQKGNPFTFIPLFIFVQKLSRVSSIFVQFEFNVFGGIIPNLALLLFLSICKLLGKEVTFELHQVILDVGELQKHVNIKNFVIQKFLNFGLKIYYWLLGLATSKVVVFEEELRERLSVFIPKEKIHTLTIATEKREVINIGKAKKLLGIGKNTFTLLVFGFINGYKGVDWIVEAIKSVKSKKIKLIIAGGENPYLRDKPFYQKFYQSIIAKIKEDKRIIQTGFVPDEKVSLYFSAADLVVLPYEVFMSASGPFSLALSFGKAIIMSSVLQDYSKSEDFHSAMRQAGLSINDLFFPLNSKSLKKLVLQAKQDKAYYKKLVNFSQDLGKLRESKRNTEKLNILLDSTARSFPASSVSPVLVQS